MTKNRTFYLLSLGEAVSKGRIIPHGKCIASLDLTISDSDAETLDDVLSLASICLSKTREFPEDEI